MDWSDRNVAVLFGDGAAAVMLQASEVNEIRVGLDPHGRSLAGLTAPI
jgi:3-oxoacyl-[acyl-carrier-protein] synthase III